MNELQNPRVPGLGLAPAPDSDRYFRPRNAALLREYGRDAFADDVRRGRPVADLLGKLAKLATFEWHRPHRTTRPEPALDSRVHRPRGPLAPVARA